MYHPPSPLPLQLRCVLDPTGRNKSAQLGPEGDWWCAEQVRSRAAYRGEMRRNACVEQGGSRVSPGRGRPGRGRVRLGRGRVRPGRGEPLGRPCVGPDYDLTVDGSGEHAARTLGGVQGGGGDRGAAG